MYGLDGQVAIVTGAAIGIGRAIALRLAQEGCRVGLFDLDGAGAETTAGMVRAAGGTAAVAIGSVAVRDDVARGLAQFERDLGSPDILVNNAGILRPDPVAALTEKAWRDTFAVNVDGVFFWCQAALPGMLARRQGAIVNMASFAGKKGQATLSAYCASKFAVIGFTQSLALETAAQGIRVNAVCPGIIVNTGMRGELEMYNAEQGLPDVSQRAKAIPMQRVGEPEDVARVVAFLASAEAGYMTGQAINVTGGLWTS
jgi:NAD(P)-dependent dehydrogenase (short-subunit alcohol dehydrogenase family)